VGKDLEVIIRCTKKLLSELKVKPKSEESPKDSFWRWHANVFHIERRKCVLVTNDSTLFTMFIPTLKKPDFQSFHLIFGQQLFKNLLHEKTPQHQIEAVLSECEDIQYERTNNRSVLGSMNDQRYQLEYFIHAEGGLAMTDIYALNHYVNKNILSAIGYKNPIEMLREKLNKITEQWGGEGREDLRRP
jgi:hypothetical protein